MLVGCLREQQESTSAKLFGKSCCCNTGPARLMAIVGGLKYDGMRFQVRKKL